MSMQLNCPKNVLKTQYEQMNSSIIKIKNKDISFDSEYLHSETSMITDISIKPASYLSNNEERIQIPLNKIDMLNLQMTPQYKHNNRLGITPIEMILTAIKKSGLQRLSEVKSIIIKQKSEGGIGCRVENTKMIYATNNNVDYADEPLFQYKEESNCLAECFIRYFFLISFF